MKRTTILLLVAAAMLAACSTTPPLPPAVAPAGDDRYLPDPRTGAPPLPAPIAPRFEAAYRYALAGDETQAQRVLGELRQRAPELDEVRLLEAFIDIRASRYDEARRNIERVQSGNRDNLVALVYEAEMAVREHQTRIAYDLYRRVAGSPNAPPTARERVTELEALLFNDLYAAAQSAPPTEAIRLLREALTFNPGAVEPRLLLAQRLVAQRQFDEARTELEPLLTSAPDRSEVQEILAEVDIGRGRYQEAIVRYDRLARRTHEARYERRLEEIKSEWSAANMPSHYRAALESTALTRSDLAVLLYWTVPSVRFARNLGTPQIAVDVEDVAGREEIIRAIAIGLYDVDPVTRRVGPYRAVSAARLSYHLARVLSLRGATCARGIPTEKILSTCGVDDPLAAFAPDANVTGRDALRYLQQVASKL